MKLSEAKALVTGGNSGLGLAVVNKLARMGARVAILDCRPVGKLGNGGTPDHKVLYLVTDVTSESEVDRSVQRVRAQFGGITLAVNCAGIARAQRVLGKDGLLAQQDFARVINVNLIGTFTVCRSVASVMQHNFPTGDVERGVIVNTASIAAFEGQIGLTAYAASKGGVASLTLPLAREFANIGVRVMAIAPGLFDTPMMEDIPEKARAALLEQVPFPKRLGRPDEFAELVCHIYENPMLNGSVIRLDGALRMPPR